MAKVKGIYKRGCVWWIRYAGLDGRIRYESSKSTKFREAEILLHKRKAEVKEGKDTAVKRIPNHTFKELAESYGQWSMRQKSYGSKRFFIQHLVNEFGNLPLKHFNTEIVEKHQTKLMVNGKKPATCNRILATLKHAFTKGVEWEMTTEEVLKKVRRVKLLKESNKRLRYLSSEECERLTEECNEYLRPVVVTALNTGMRKEEILSLKWSMVDMRNGLILLEDTKNGERREIPINSIVKEILQALTRYINSPYVFTDRNGGRHKAMTIYKSFNSAVRKAGIKDFHFHDMRHTFASHLVMAGWDLTTVKELLGHKSIAMTLRYAHLAPDHKAKAVEALGSVLGGSVLSSEASSIQKLYNSGEKANVIR